MKKSDRTFIASKSNEVNLLSGTLGAVGVIKWRLLVNFDGSIGKSSMAYCIHWMTHMQQNCVSHMTKSCEKNRSASYKVKNFAPHLRLVAGTHRVTLTEGKVNLFIKLEGFVLFFCVKLQINTWDSAKILLARKPDHRKIERSGWEAAVVRRRRVVQKKWH